MRARPGSTETTAELEYLLELSCTPDLPAEDQAAARQRLRALTGPFADTIQQLCARTTAAQRQLLQTRRELARFTQGVRLRGIVTAVDATVVRVVLGTTERVLPRPPELTVAIGQTVLTDGDGRAIVAAGGDLVGGQAYVFCEPLGEGRYALVRSLREGALDDARQMALVAASVDLDGIAAGDRVLGWSIDGGNVVVVTRRLGPVAAPVDDDVASRRRISRDDLVGLDDVIAEAELLFLASDLPAFAPLIAATDKSSAGALFQGIAGTGKTELARLLMQQVRDRGGRALYRTASHYLSKWVGEGAALLRADTQLLDSAYRESGVRPLLVIDELEAIAIDRSHAAALTGGHLDVLGTLLSVVSTTNARVIGISNVGDRWIDHALTRAGRLRPIVFPRTASPDGAATIVASCLAGVALAPISDRGPDGDGDRARAFGEAVSDLVYAPSGELAELLRVQLADGRVLTVGAADLATPAALADGIVRPVLRRVVRRDTRKGLAAPTPLTIGELRAETVAYFTGVCATITRDNIRGLVTDKIPEDQAVTGVQRVSVTAAGDLAARAAAA